MCVHLVSHTGVDFLFQDVDITWFKDPREYFHDEKQKDHTFDIYFQDDGARSLRYAPYSANSGFYYVRNNDRTQYFLTQLMLSGDLILKTYSHQQALVAVLTEHSSLFGLRVKVFGKEDDAWPGGFHYHQKGDNSYFRRYFDNKTAVDPYVFHMSWTFNKDNKLLFLKQLGEWYVHDKCIDKKLEDIELKDVSFLENCCSSEALFSCHFRDKPSKEPCHDSPAIDNGKASFWKVK